MSVMTNSLFFFSFFLALPFILSAQDSDPYPPTAVPDRIILTWSDNPATSQSVNWRTSTIVQKAWGEIAESTPNSDFIVYVDTVPATSERVLTNMNEALFHSVCFKNLKPSTKYVYRVGDGSNYSEWFQFETAAAGKAPFSFLYFGDAQNNIKSLWARCIRQGYSTVPDIDFILHAGDLINKAQRDEEWGDWFYSGGWIFGTCSNIAVPGNHEYYRDEGGRKLSTLWNPTFTLPENGPESLRETVYYTDYQDMRIIGLNTTATYADPATIDIQKEWLEKVLQDNPNTWTVVTQHHPIYSTATRRDNPKIREAFQPIFEKYNVDLVLQGHDHTYGRGHNVEYGLTHRDRGPMYVVSVSGPKMYLVNFDDWLERAASNTQLYQIISVDGKKLNYEAYTVEGELYDAFELTKKSNGKTRFKDKTSKSEIEERGSIPPKISERMTEEEIELYRQRFRAYQRRLESNN